MSIYLSTNAYAMRTLLLNEQVKVKLQNRIDHLQFDIEQRRKQLVNAEDHLENVLKLYSRLKLAVEHRYQSVQPVVPIELQQLRTTNKLLKQDLEEILTKKLDPRIFETIRKKTDVEIVQKNKLHWSMALERSSVFQPRRFVGHRCGNGHWQATSSVKIKTQKQHRRRSASSRLRNHRPTMTNQIRTRRSNECIDWADANEYLSRSRLMKDMMRDSIEAIDKRALIIRLTSSLPINIDLSVAFVSPHQLILQR